MTFANELKPPLDEALEHYGVLGMKWGVRRTKEQLSRARGKTTDRAAKKDAKEAARAKMFYGEGAGTRRKLIKATVEAKKKKDPAYAAAFDAYLESQDLSKHASKATKERKSTDRKTRTKQRAGALARMTTGQMGTQAAFIAVAAGGYRYMQSPQGQKIMNTSKSYLNSLADEAKRKRNVHQLNKLFNNS